jgi:predicted AAA+ superfamily ATPase
MASYTRKEDRLSYLRTKDDVEIDLIVERSKKHLWAIEVKSSKSVSVEGLSATLKLAEDIGAKRLIIACQETRARKIGNIEILPWRQVIDELYG